MLRIPDGARLVMERLHEAGFEAYVVGGCVRDALLGLEPSDWDLCTSARPEEMQRVFAGFHVVETGLQHGTLTIVIDHVPYETTTFRVDGAYTDHRHPDGVTFVSRVEDDLARRDFTINAMAYHPETGLVDAFGGQEDLKRRVIRCVGAPEKRFEEDALRILRALRFASTYDFQVDAATAEAVHRLYPSLRNVAAERIRVELQKLLCGKGVGRILREYADVITYLLPELAPCVGFDQKTPFHRYDVWEHTLRAVEAVAPQVVLRWAMLLHDSGKPACFSVDEQGVGHAYGHSEVSRQYAEQAMERLKMDHATRDKVLMLVARHDVPMDGTRKLLMRRLNQHGEEGVRELIEVHRADALAKGTLAPQQVNAWADDILRALDALLAEKPCVTLKALAIRGDDLLRAGCPKGRTVGICLERLLEQVMAGEIPNEREALLDAARAFWQQPPARSEQT